MTDNYRPLRYRPWFSSSYKFRFVWSRWFTYYSAGWMLSGYISEEHSEVRNLVQRSKFNITKRLQVYGLENHHDMIKIKYFYFEMINYQLLSSWLGLFYLHLPFNILVDDFVMIVNGFEYILVKSCIFHFSTTFLTSLLYYGKVSLSLSLSLSLSCATQQPFKIIYYKPLILPF